MNFWTTLPKPFFVLAPMEGVTDVVFREIVATRLPAPHVFFTEFTNIDGLNSEGKNATLMRLKLTKAQHPVVAQLWGTRADNMEKSAALCAKLGFDGIDINMGCPDRAVTKSGGGSALINTPSIAANLIRAVRVGAKQLPLSVKTRIGVNTIQTDEWISFLFNQNIDVLTIHGRTAKQKSDAPANWEEIGKAVKLKNEIAPHTLVVGNGDVESVAAGHKMMEQYGVDGIMIGRGIFHNPWVFENSSSIHSKEEYLTVLRAHVELYTKTWGEGKNFDVMKKFFKMYVNSFPGAAEFRAKLMECSTPEEVYKLL
jgi:nifR3 family TIM-barrel protein